MPVSRHGPARPASSRGTGWAASGIISTHTAIRHLGATTWLSFLTGASRSGGLSPLAKSSPQTMSAGRWRRWRGDMQPQTNLRFDDPGKRDCVRPASNSKAAR